MRPKPQQRKCTLPRVLLKDCASSAILMVTSCRLQVLQQLEEQQQRLTPPPPDEDSLLSPPPPPPPSVNLTNITVIVSATLRSQVRRGTS